MAQKNKLELAQSSVLNIGMVRRPDKNEEGERRNVFADYKQNRQKQTGIISSKVKVTSRYFDSEIVDN